MTRAWMAMGTLAVLAASSAGVAVAAEGRPGEAPAAANAKSPAVAVLYLDYAGEDEELAALRKGLAQMLVTDLSVNPKLKLVERLQLESVLQELELTTTRKIDGATAAKIGKLLGAKYLVMGGYFELVGTLRIDVRVVDVETGALVKGFGVNGKQDEFLALEQAIVTGLDAILMSVTEAGGARGGGDKKGMAPRDKTAARDEAGVKRRPQAPPRLRTKTAARYGKALDLMDNGDNVAARAELEKVVAEEPGFGLAQNDLQKLVQ